MKQKGEDWEGVIIDLALTAVNPPFIVSCRIGPRGSDETKFVRRYFTVDADIELPISEEEIIERWILPRLNGG